jgi:hypothetical protein
MSARVKMMCAAIGLACSGAALGQTGAPVAPPSPTLPAPCSTPAHAALDFWVGEWDVFRPDTGAMVARSRIDKLHGCVIREQWMPLAGAGGSSLSHYDAVQRQWRQLWLDGTGSRVEFAGGPVGETMVLTGFWPSVNGPRNDGLIRMTYSRLPDGDVRQRGEVSTDQGVTWSLNFLFDYRRTAR